MAREACAVVLGDVHAPYQDDPACQVAFRLLRELQPDDVFCNGDWVDFYQLSRFDPDPSRKLELHKDIELAKVLLRAVRANAPNARLWFKQGNHEHRLDRWRFRNPEVGMLPCLALSSLLEFEQIGCKYVGAMQRLGWQGVTITHGDLCRKRGGATAQAMIDRFGTSGVSNHVHRLARVAKRDAVSDCAWIENGCLCKLDAEYCEVADWEHGLTVLTRAAGRVWSEVVRIEDGAAWFRGALVTADGFPAA